MTDQGDAFGAVLYTYDASGAPTWALGFARGGSRTIEMQRYAGACPSCAPDPAAATGIGTLSIQMRGESALTVTSRMDLAMPAGARLSTGMLVIYEDDESFTLMTPQGHMESGWITFSAYVEDGVTVAQVESLARANDPFFEVGFLLFAHRSQERFWQHTLRSLAARFGVDGRVSTARACLDPRTVPAAEDDEVIRALVALA